jgi:hypothetical protein
MEMDTGTARVGAQIIHAGHSGWKAISTLLSTTMPLQHPGYDRAHA